MDLRAKQAPIKEKYKADPKSSFVTMKAEGSQTDTPLACSVDIGRAIYEAEAHAGVGGTGTHACSGDLLLGALAACAQITCQMVAEAMGIYINKVQVKVEGDLDLRGTLGIDRTVPVGFQNIRIQYVLDAPGARPEQLSKLKEKTERYCVVLQTLTHPPKIEWSMS